MRKATIRIVRNDDAILRAAADGFAAAWAAGEGEGDLFTFSSPAQLFAVLPPTRWDLLERLQKLGPATRATLSSLLERDIADVEADLVPLIEWGFVEAQPDGRVLVPFDVIHADFNLSAAA